MVPSTTGSRELLGNPVSPGAARTDRRGAAASKATAGCAGSIPAGGRLLGREVLTLQRAPKREQRDYTWVRWSEDEVCFDSQRALRKVGSHGTSRTASGWAASFLKDRMCKVSVDVSSCHGGGHRCSPVQVWALHCVLQPRERAELQEGIAAPPVRLPEVRWVVAPSA